MIQGKTAIVTGGSRGIGAATAKKLASLGANIAVIYAGNEAAANAVCEECRAHGVKAEAFQCDVADFAQTKETVALIKEAFGTVDILINCAGITRDKLLAMMREDDFDAVIATNLKGTWNMIRQCCGIFIRNKGGSIVNVSSVVGLTGNAGQSNYSASKAGIIGLTKSTAKELAAKNIRCNAVAPGFIATDMTKDLGGEDSPWLKMIPLARAGEAEEVAEAIVFLADAAYITGEVLRVDGGMAM
ncbi:MAG: 3-oxoacyl-ACP reductase family protein [Peptococcaceae bacterium]|nr:3-oxoacyl-ACP reductase family protein [Peptococcaceae bacterium]MEE0206600.1 3-oxoacyl-ACP reductase family protein [Peptococcaceae bacterium]